VSKYESAEINKNNKELNMKNLKGTCFFASIGPSQTPITIRDFATSAAACIQVSNFYIFLFKFKKMKTENKRI